MTDASPRPMALPLSHSKAQRDHTVEHREWWWCYLNGADGYAVGHVIAGLTAEETEQRAALIVEAVNGWDEEQRTMMDSWRARRKREQAVIDAARAAMASGWYSGDLAVLRAALRALDDEGE